MPIYVNTNVSSLVAQRNLGNASSTLQTSMQRISSGLRINSARDDAAGLSVSTKMGTLVRSLDQTVRNANDGVSLAQTAEGAIGEIQNMLQRGRELAVQSANGSLSGQDRIDLASEWTALVAEVTRVASTASFNGVNLLDGSYTGQSFQIGTESSGTISFSMVNMTAGALGGSALGTNTYSTSVTGELGAEIASSGTSYTSSFTAGDLTLNGYRINAGSSDGVSASYATASAIAKAAAINAVTSSTGVVATVNSLALLGASFCGDASAYATAIADSELLINGVSIGALGAASGMVQRASDLAAAINAVKSTTGVTASLVVNSALSGRVSLYAADGRNISIVASTAASGGVIGLGIAQAGGSTTYVSTITLTSTSSSGITIGGTSSATFGLSNELGLNAASVSSGAGVSAIDLTTQSGAQAALAVLDKALVQTSSQRASLGAIQSRFNSAIATNQATSENLSIARGRIRDADFALETANLTRSQILQQAAASMSTQANSASSLALSLLQ